MRQSIQTPTIGELRLLAEDAAKSQLFGDINTPSKALIVMLSGLEKGLSITSALSGLHVLHGKLAMRADTMAAAVLASGLCEAWRVTRFEPELCTITTTRVGAGTPAERTTERSFSMADATRAKINVKNENWQKYPAQMLKARCIAMLAREVYPDVLAGCYTEDELKQDDSAQSPAALAPVRQLDVQAKQLEPAPTQPEGVDWAKLIVQASERPKPFSALFGVGAKLATSDLGATREAVLCTWGAAAKKVLSSLDPASRAQAEELLRKGDVSPIASYAIAESPAKEREPGEEG